MKRHKVVVWVAVGLAVLFVAALVVGGLAVGCTGCGYGRGMMGGFGLPYGMHMFGGGIAMVLLGLLIVGGLVLLVTFLVSGEKTPAHKDEAALEILKRRYASGEIDREEFERIKETLMH